MLLDFVLGESGPHGLSTSYSVVSLVEVLQPPQHCCEFVAVDLDGDDPLTLLSDLTNQEVSSIGVEFEGNSIDVVGTWQ